MLIGVGLLAGCESESSSDVNQDRIYTEYELTYNKNQDKTFARARFRFGNATGTLLELDEASSIQFEGDELAFNSTLANYEKSYAGRIAEGTFRFQDNEGNVYENSLQNRPIEFPMDFDTIPKGSSYDLAWAGDSLGSQETVELFVDGENLGDGQVFVANDDGASTIILGKDQIDNLGTGPGTAYMSRTYRPDLLQSTGAGGVMRGVFRTEDRQVVITN
jgi:hypothetical protein